MPADDDDGVDVSSVTLDNYARTTHVRSRRALLGREEALT